MRWTLTATLALLFAGAAFAEQQNKRSDRGIWDSFNPSAETPVRDNPFTMRFDRNRDDAWTTRFDRDRARRAEERAARTDRGNASDIRSGRTASNTHYGDLTARNEMDDGVPASTGRAAYDDNRIARGTRLENRTARRAERYNPVTDQAGNILPYRSQGQVSDTYGYKGTARDNLATARAERRAARAEYRAGRAVRAESRMGPAHSARLENSRLTDRSAPRGDQGTMGRSSVSARTHMVVRAPEMSLPTRFHSGRFVFIRGSPA